MNDRSIEILKNLKKHLEMGTLKVEEFPTEDVLDMVQAEYDQWMAEKNEQLNEYMKIYRLWVQMAANASQRFELAKLLGELLDDLEKSPIDAIERMAEKIWKITLEQELIDYAKKAYSSYPFQSSLGTVAFEGKGVIYMVITGNYDALREPDYIDPAFDYICFTDSRELHSDVWDIRYIENPEGLDLVRLARKHKILCHQYLKGYDYSIYVDGKMQIIGSLKDYIRKYSKGSPMLCFPHCQRKCAYDEADICARIGKDAAEIIYRQMERYKKEGYPEHNGLIDSACLVRRHDDEQLQKVMECWWEEVSGGSRRDQLSIGYACWKNDFHYDLCDLFAEKNEYIHKRRDREICF